MMLNIFDFNDEDGGYEKKGFPRVIHSKTAAPRPLPIERASKA